MNQDMLPKEVPNWMLYDLVERRFNEMDRKFDAIDRRFEAIDRRFEALEAKVEKNTESINELYLNRDKLKLTFSNGFALGTGLFSAVIAFFTALFTGTYVVKLRN